MSTKTMNTDKPNNRYAKNKYGEEDAVKAKILCKTMTEKQAGKMLMIPQRSVNRLKHRDLSPNGSGLVKKTLEWMSNQVDGVLGKSLNELMARDFKALTIHELGILSGIFMQRRADIQPELGSQDGVESLMNKSDEELDRIIQGDVEITNAEVEIGTPQGADNKHYVSLDDSKGTEGPKISNPGADDID